jgi:hypothetical protein
MNREEAKQRSEEGEIGMCSGVSAASSLPSLLRGEEKGSEMPVVEIAGVEPAPAPVQADGGIGEAPREPRVRAQSEMKTLCKADRRARFDLGLAVAALHATPGVPMTTEQLADFCGCSHQYMWQVEKKALRKLRKAIGPDQLAELRTFLHHREPNLPCAPSDFARGGSSES